MHNEDRNTNGTGRTISLSFGTVCFILSMIFMILKLCHVIDWGWVFVFLPLIISVGLTVLIIVILVIITIVCAFLN